MSPRKITGGCHCGAIRFTATIDLGEPTLRCNCSICTKSRAWITPIPADDFALDEGSETPTKYRFGAKVITHCFCPRCGVKTHGRIKGQSGADEFFAVSVQCLDLSPKELELVPRSYVDGLNDRQDGEPELVGYL
ncbi:GFA family protein [Cognatiyoonia sp. IB215182]|uniref:GFA family protein n=1 Tax=Cognatiyoonia sp. IB215182 TaxID=3097353 RepID=UPI002A0E8215|nr:GFA family protein [Cognatiyoonia sp. IB215182]MDX8354858.1 GFA family protein [Cognatiyoonia sp. IB215182]